MSLKIYAVGDIMLGEQLLCNNFGVKKIIQKNGTDYLFEEVIPLFRDGDIVFGNLECSFMKRNSKTDGKSFFFFADPDIVKGLKNAHFNVLSVANNHVMENGREYFINTIQILKDNGITPVGIKKKYDLINIKGHRIAFLAYSFIEDSISNTCYNKVQSENTIIEDIRNVKRVSDFIIVSLHWGCEYVPYPSPDQIQIGRKFVDAGADTILGGHPHVTQGFEIYKDRPIIYSLGNFIFDLTFIPPTNESFIAEINIGDSPGSIKVNIIPFLINMHTYRPQLLEGSQKDTFLKNVSLSSNLFENRSLSEYLVTIGDYNILHNNKKQAAKWNMKIQFTKNFYRYSFLTFCNILKQYIGKQKRELD